MAEAGGAGVVLLVGWGGSGMRGVWGSWLGSAVSGVLGGVGRL